MKVLLIKLLINSSSAQLDKVLTLKSQKHKLKVINLLFFICIFYFLSLKFYFIAFAAENFKTDYAVTYSVKDDGVTSADMIVTLTNTSADYYYASSYKIELGFNNISNIRAIDLGGALSPIVEKDVNGYTVQLDFNKRVVGESSKQEFTLSFDTTDIAQKVGKIWEINIPGIDNEQKFNSFNVKLNVPKSFGSPEYIKPLLDKNNLQFNKEQLTKSGISLAFGKNQQYSFTLIYHLHNKNLFPIKTEIAIPMNTNYQDVFIDSISPEPVQVRKDADGNWLATYELEATEKIDVKTKGKVNIFLNPRTEKITKEEIKLYLQEKPYWQISDADIQAVSKNLKSAEKIYDYVVETLDYDYTRITNSSNRLGAVNILKNPQTAVCLEFTDLFIALARAAGIPAREVDGYAFTQNQRQRPLSLVTDILHAWPEYYDFTKNTWVMVDPTWADTTNGVDYFHTLDFDHFAFIKKGVSSDYPIPAGGYKIVGSEDKKDVFVWASNEEVKSTSTLILESENQQSYLAGFPINAELTIQNKGPIVSKEQSLYVYSQNLKPQSQIIKVDELLPFERKIISYSFRKQNFLTKQTDTVTILFAGKDYEKKFIIKPFYENKIYLIGGIAIVIFTLTIFIITIKTGRLFLSR